MRAVFFRAMLLTRWLRPPRQMLAVFLGVALVSAGALGWLGWQLLRQDVVLETQRRRDALEQAADRASATMQLVIADLQTALNAPVPAKPSLPSGVSRISTGPDRVAVWPEGSIPYFPFARAGQPEPAQEFSEGERAEFGSNDLEAAARAYTRTALALDPMVRAGSLARLARVHRKLHDNDAALHAYSQLATIDVDVGGIPAGLVAHVGRAGLFEGGGRAADLQHEAASLDRHLRQGAWALTKSEYDFYSSLTSAWLNEKRVDDREAIARADALDWLWQNRAALDGTVRRALELPRGAAVMIARVSHDRLDAIVAGPAYLTSLCSTATPEGLHCHLSDPEGRALTGDRVQVGDVAVRAASANGLPWTLHLSAIAVAPPAASPRRRLLMLAFVVVALVLAAGWYFILWAMSRELRVSRLQSEFVAAVSHEFRSPLTSMSHIAELLATDRLRSEEVRRKSYDVLVRDSNRLQRLVEDLLDFGRFEAGAAALRLEMLDVASVVRTTVGDFQSHAATAGYSVELAGVDTDIPVRADREAIARALWNLLDNAVKYSPECHTVWVTVDKRPDGVSIEVRDRGLGIPVHEQREIFNRFVRGAESTVRRIRGTGLGLAMVRQIVHAHGGEVHVASEPGKGSTFTTVLPAVAS